MSHETLSPPARGPAPHSLKQQSGLFLGSSCLTPGTWAQEGTGKAANEACGGGMCHSLPSPLPHLERPQCQNHSIPVRSWGEAIEPPVTLTPLTGAEAWESEPQCPGQTIG